MRLGESVSVLLNYRMESVRLSVKMGDLLVEIVGETDCAANP